MCLAPFFMEQKKTGVLSITDPRMTRFWITLEQTVEFVLHRLEDMVGGELFIPKIPSMNIMDLAKAVAPECKTRTVGIRPGEKLHEVLIPKNEARNTVELKSHFIIQPQFDFWGKRFIGDGAEPVPDSFEYSSDMNPDFLTVDDMRKLINQFQESLEGERNHAHI